MADETTALLRVRLRSVSFILSGAFGLFLIQGFILKSWHLHLLDLTLLHVTVVLVLGVTGVVLSQPLCLSLKQLRWLELGIFWLPAAFHVCRQYKGLMICVERNESLSLLADTLISVLFWYALMACYCMFIPNTWQRAARIVGPVALVPLLIPPLVVGDQSIANRVITADLMSSLTLFLLIMTVAFVYGTHVINTLRLQTFETETRRRAIFHATPEGIILTDEKGTMASCNPAAERLFGYTGEEAIGQNVRLLLAPPFRDDPQVFKESPTGPSRELVGLRKDHTTFPIELDVVELRVNERRLFTGIIRDITERKRAEQALREKERRFRAIFDNTFEFMGLLTPDGTVLEANQTALDFLGLKREDVRGQPAWETPWFGTSPEARDRCRAAVAEAAQGRFVRYEVVADGVDGKRLTMDFSLQPITDENGQVVLLIPEGRDISERKRAEAELHQAKEAAEAANRAKSEFLANMSHEIRTPMNGILGMTELTLETELTPRQREFLGLVKTSADSLLALLNDILDFSKIEAGKFELEDIPFRVRDVVGDTLSTLALRAHHKGLELACHIRSDVPDGLVGDQVRLQQILVNLAGNAIKFTDRGEVVVHVALEAQTEDAVYLHLSVTDTGIGIPREKQRVIFNAFEQADTSTTRKHGGTGLGLAISSELARMMGGRIWVESEVGIGSTFHVTMRFGRQQGLEPPAVADLADLQDLPVLVVDDNATNRHILHELLTNWRMKPTVADGAAVALTILTQAHAAGKPFALVLSDVNMPDIDGFTLAQRIKEDPHHAQMPILMLTSADRPGDVDRCLALGLAGHLIKPVKQSTLLEAILRAMGKRVPHEQRDRSVKHLPIRPSRRPLQILLAEDNDINQTMAINLLEKWGHRIVVASNGREALEALEKQRFDVVLMDVQMPEMDGFKATAAIRAKEKDNGARLPIIAMTAHALKGDRERCLAAGMDGYVSKPIKSSELQAILDRLVPATALPVPEPANGAVLDKAALLDYVDHDRELLVKIVKRFRVNSPTLLAKVEEAVARGDSQALEFSAHTLKGAVGNFFAEAAREAALRLETLGHDGNLQAAPEALGALSKELDRLNGALRDLEEAVPS
jgi:PAS domain S-box-containing protein